MESNKMRMLVIVAVVVVAAVIGGVKWKNGREAAELAAMYQQKLAAEEAYQAEKDATGGEVSVWKNYTAPNKSFSATFPGTPVYSEKKLSADIVYYQHEVTLPQGGTYLVHAAENTGGFETANTSAELKKSLDNTVAGNSNYKLLDSSATTFAGKQALGFTIQAGSSFFKGNLFISGNTLYQVGIQYDILEYSREFEDTFFNSFKLLP